MKDGSGGGLSRRRAIAGIVGGGLGAASLPAGADAPHAHPPAQGPAAASASAAWTPEFLSAHQFELLEALGERIVPRSGEAQAARFVDKLLAVDTRETQRRFLESLSAFESTALARFTKPFAKLTAAEQDEVLASAAAQEEARASKETSWGWFAVPEAAGARATAPDLGAHLRNLKRWISGAYYSSEAGMKELGWTGNKAFESFPGCGHGEHG